MEGLVMDKESIIYVTPDGMAMNRSEFMYSQTFGSYIRAVIEKYRTLWETIKSKFKAMLDNCISRGITFFEESTAATPSQGKRYGYFSYKPLKCQVLNRKPNVIRARTCC
jgi:hypothetical protein